MIYCVIPRDLADELYDKMVDYYRDNPNVTVIVDRREGSDRRGAADAQGHDERRAPNQFRNRRRARMPGTFPDTPAPERDALA